MKTVTLTDLRRNLENYILEAQNGDIIITRYGKEVGRLVAADANGNGPVVVTGKPVEVNGNGSSLAAVA